MHAELSTLHVFQLQLGKSLPTQLLPYMRLCACREESQLKHVDLSGGELFPDCEQDGILVEHLVACLHARLMKCVLPPPFNLSVLSGFLVGFLKV